MKWHIQFTIALTAIVLAYSGAFIAFPQSSREIGLDVWNYEDEERELAQCEQQMIDLQSKSNMVIDRIWTKAVVCRLLANGEISLTDAVDQISENYQSDPDSMGWITRRFPSPSLKISMAMHLIEHVSAMKSSSDPSQIRDAVKRLENELSEIKRDASSNSK